MQVFEGETVEEIIGCQRRASLHVNLNTQREYIAQLEKQLKEGQAHLTNLLTKGE